MKRLRLFKFKVQWSPYSTAIRATNKKDARKKIRKQYPNASGEFFHIT